VDNLVGMVVASARLLEGHDIAALEILESDWCDDEEISRKEGATHTRPTVGESHRVAA
jgi:hypothetical protein